MATQPHCRHEPPLSDTAVCAHLRRDAAPWISAVRWFTGKGLAYELVCRDCAATREKGGDVAVGVLCHACFDYVIAEVADVFGSRGSPGILERPDETATNREVLRSPLPKTLGAVIDVAPIAAASGSCWLTLSSEGAICVFEANAGRCTHQMTIQLPDEPEREPWAGHHRAPRLHASDDGRFAAVVNDYGRFGVVLDLEQRARTLALDGGDYYPETVPFSLAFIGRGADTAVVHRTAWNRLDVSDPRSGRLLSARGPTEYSRGEPRPPHYLDYFHGRLHRSPDGEKLVDDGWLWHPVGLPVVWNAHRWIRENVWESEDGPSRIELKWRDGYWDHAMCWLSERQLVIGGIGEDSDTMIDGALVYEFDPAGRLVERDGKPWVRTFAGPAGHFFGDGARLFSSDAAGLSIWDVTDGARIGRVPDVSPTHCHRSARELVEIKDGAMLRFAF